MDQMRNSLPPKCNNKQKRKLKRKTHFQNIIITLETEVSIPMLEFKIL